ncbi:Diphthamide biosynthesis protein 4 [Linum grandiflorum]
MLGYEYSVEETHYEILSVKEDARYEEIRSGYRSAILDSHPDKASDSATVKFIKVQKAWEILSDSRLRAAYDNDLRASRQQEDSQGWEDIDLEDMVVEERGERLELCYQCRCGDYFSVDSLDLGTMGYKLLRDGNCVAFESSSSEEGLVPLASVVIPCGSCSLYVRLLINREI